MYYYAKARRKIGFNQKDFHSRGIIITIITTKFILINIINKINHLNNDHLDHRDLTSETLFLRGNHVQRS